MLRCPPRRAEQSPDEAQPVEVGVGAAHNGGESALAPGSASALHPLVESGHDQCAGRLAAEPEGPLPRFRDRHTVRKESDLLHPAARERVIASASAGSTPTIRTPAAAVSGR